MQYVSSGYVTTTVMICNYWWWFNVTTERETLKKKKRIHGLCRYVQCAVSNKTQKYSNTLRTQQPVWTSLMKFEVTR